MRRALELAVIGAVLAGCAGEPPQGGTALVPTKQMTEVLAERQAMAAKRPYNVYYDEAVLIPSVTDAAQAIPNVSGLPAPTIEVSQIDEVSPAGQRGPGALDGTLYRPANARNLPIIIFFPGGTWAYRSEQASDQAARQLELRTGWEVLLVRPRLAPEAQFPGAHDDAVAAYGWALGQLRGWGADPTRVVLAGEGPGANLALATALAARDGTGPRPLPLPAQLLLITPWAGTATDTASMAENSGANPMNRASVRWAQREYARGHLDDPRLDLAARTDLQRLPPTTIVLADIDPLRSGAETLAEHLRAAGVRTDVRTYHGVTYGFFPLGAYVDVAAQAEADTASALRGGFSRF